VIKIEAPSGDIMRHVGPMRNPGMGHIYLNLNRNKRSIALDLKQTDARDALRKLAATADVMVSNVRPAAMARLGLGYDDIRSVNPRIIYASATGYGAGGRYAGKPAYDDLIQGLSGIAAIARDAWGGEPRYMPIAIADRTVGLYLANAISAALFHRERTGEGQAIEIPMFEVFAEYLLGDHLAGLTFDPPEGPQYYPRLVSKHRRPYATRDGHVCALVYTDAHWKNFFRAIGREELLQDPRFSTHGNRADHIDEVYEFVADTLKTKTTAEWVALLDDNDIPVTPLHDIKSLLDDPHLNDVGFFRLVDHPTEGRLRMTQVPGSWSASQPQVRSLPPGLGDHTAQVLREAGLSESEIERLMAAAAKPSRA
jgi:crotonobetainyl-CoA:carnitine CoA-transferase CaiB-like acyl-CoA transferase